MTIECNLDEIDLAVYGGTEAGIFTAVQAARCGLKTALVSETDYPFGFFPSLGAWETHYTGCRAPLSWEFRDKIVGHYRDTFGENSKRYRDCINLEDNNPMVTFEPNVAEKLLQELIDAENNLTVIAPCGLLAVRKKKGKVESITLKTAQENMELHAFLFIDCSYTGDLTAMTGAEYSHGRESQSEFGEPHAGRIFTRWKEGRYPQASLEGTLNLLPTWTTTDPLPGSTGEGDDCVQDYSYRICLSNEAENRMLPSKPTNYDREKYVPLLLPTEEKARLELPFHHRWLTQTIDELVENDHLFHGHALPGNKRSWNATNFTGAGKKYAESNNEERQNIEDQHRNHALGLLYFLQNDSAVPPHIQKLACQWGLAKDEFVNSGNFPPALYVREARRFKGSYRYREQDCLQEGGLNRAPIHRDGIAFTEFALDSLPCSPKRWKGSSPEGQFFEKDKSLPGSLPWRCLIPHGLDNLIVPTAPSVTHCAWGTVRQTACLLHLAEVCAYAAALCKQQRTVFTDLSPLELQIHLVKHGTMLSFFNDFDMESPEPWKEAALLFGNHGFFADYNARPEDPLDYRLAKLWTDELNLIVSGHSSPPNEVARQVRDIEESINRYNINGPTFSSLLASEERASLDAEIVRRKQGLEALYSVLLDSTRHWETPASIDAI